MLRQGPIPRFLHGLIEYGVGVLFLAGPSMLGFSDQGGPTSASIVAGVVVLVVAASTNGPTSLVNQISLGIHVVFDYVLAIALIAMPFLAGFSDEATPTAFFITLGAAHLLMTIGTRFRPAKEARR
jgi:hypothetical protein